MKEIFVIGGIGFCGLFLLYSSERITSLKRENAVLEGKIEHLEQVNRDLVNQLLGAK